MSDIPDNANELILELLKSIGELNDQFKPLLKGATEQEQILTRHTQIIEKLSEITIENKETLKEVQNVHEMYSQEIRGLFKEYDAIHEDIDKQLKKIKYRPIEKIYQKSKKAHKISDNEYEELLEFINLYPEDSIVYSTIGHVLWNINEDPKKTVTYFEKAVELDNSNYTGLCGLVTFSENKEKFIKNLKELTKEEGIRCPTLASNIAINYAEFGDYDKAIMIADEMIEKDPEDSKTYALKGQILSLFMDKPGQAISVLEKGLGYDENNIAILNLLGMSYNKMKMEEKSASYFINILNMDKENINAMHNLSLLYYDNKKYEEALNLINKILKIQPNSCDYCLRGRIYESLDKKEDAISNIEQALDIYDYKAQFCTTIFNLYFNLIKDNVEIESIIKETYEKYEDSTNYLVALIDLYDTLDKKENIFDIIKKLDYKSIDNPRYLNSIAYSLYNLNIPDIAINYSTKLIELDDNNPNFLDTHACILSKLEKNEEAKEFFIKATKQGKKENITWDEMKSVFTKLDQNELFESFLENLQE